MVYNCAPFDKGEPNMKKFLLIIIVAIGSVLLGYWLLQTPQPTSPIIISSQYDEENGQIEMSYLVDAKSDTRLERMNVEGEIITIKKSMKEKVFVAQSGYELRTVSIPVSKNLQRVLTVKEQRFGTIEYAFKNEKTTLSMLFVMLAQESKEAEEADGALTIDIKPVNEKVITAIHSYNSKGEVSTTIADEPLQLPHQVIGNEIILMTFEKGYKLAPNDRVLFEINYADGSREFINVKLQQKAKGNVLKKFVKQ